MSMADINSYHKLETILISPVQLYLDPSNPRLIVDAEDDISYSNEKILSSDLQNDVLEKINESEFKVDDLVKSITEKGFMGGTTPLIVKEIGDTGKYLVLEGNRRTAAIKSILRNKSRVDDSCLDTLINIEAKKFIYKNNNKYSEEQIINIILGQIHVSGALGWGAMERAHYIYRSYLMEIRKLKLSKSFVINKDSLKNVSDVYSFKESEIQKNLKIYRVYDQIRDAGYSIKSDRFSLIELAVSDSALSYSYFELNSQLQFSDVGLDRFINLIDPNEGPVKNPRLFRQFSYIFKNGTDDDVNKVEKLIADIGDVYADVMMRKKGSYLYDRLNKIHEEIQEIDISELSELSLSSREFTEAQRIVHTVIKKLYPIIENIKKSNGNDLSKLPASIHEAICLNSKSTQNIIRNTFKSFKNKTCVADIEYLIGSTLKYLNIVANGDMKKVYFENTRDEVVKMMASGIIKVYKTSSSERFKLMG